MKQIQKPSLGLTSFHQFPSEEVDLDREKIIEGVHRLSQIALCEQFCVVSVVCSMTICMII